MCIRDRTWIDKLPDPYSKLDKSPLKLPVSLLHVKSKLLFVLIWDSAPDKSNNAKLSKSPSHPSMITGFAAGALATFNWIVVEFSQ